MKPVVIAIDGPAGSGKGTIARRLASILHFAYLDTGLFYRAIAHMGVTAAELVNVSLEQFLSSAKEIPEVDLRSDAVSSSASDIAKIPEIREIVTKFIRNFAANPGEGYDGSVMDGRDIGTVVIPDSICKIYLTADLSVRANRRFSCIKEINPDITLEEVTENLRVRDNQDTLRKVAPLTFGKSYILIDTSSDTIEESVARVEKIVRKSLLLADFD